MLGGSWMGLFWVAAAVIISSIKAIGDAPSRSSSKRRSIFSGPIIGC
jgi:hypothetical protein